MKLSGKYPKSYVLGLQNSMEYRANFVLSMLSTVFPVLMQFVIWSAVYRYSDTPTVFNYSYTQMIAYILLAGVVSKLVVAGFEWEVADDIKNGGLDKFVVKPVDYFLFRFFSFLGQRTPHYVLSSAIISAILLIMQAASGMELEIKRIMLFLLMLVFSLVINCLLFFIISTLAFLITEVWHTFYIFGVIVSIISGGVFPLDVFGDGVVAVLSFLPFKYTVYDTINVAGGKLGFQHGLGILGIQALWVLFLAAVCNAVWKKGMKKYTATGG